MTQQNPVPPLSTLPRGLRSPRVAAVATGICLIASFPPYNASFLAWVAYLPLLWHWNRAASPGEAFRLAYGAHLVFYCGAFYWVANHHLSHVALASLSGLLILPAFHSLPFALTARSVARVPDSLRWAALASLSLLIEAFLLAAPFGIPWGLLGNSQSAGLRFIQMADLGGVLLISAWVWLLNGASWWLLRTEVSARRWIRIAGVGLLVGVPLLYSLVRLAEEAPDTPTLTFGLLQPAFEPSAWAVLDDDQRVDSLLALTQAFTEVHPDVSVVLWPETALPPLAGPAEFQALLDRLQSFVSDRNITLATGAIRHPETGVYRNSIIAFAPHSAQEVYDKHRLVPFAEAVPYADRWPWLNAFSLYAGGAARYIPGGPAQSLHTDSLSLGIMICYETLFPAHSRSLARDGAQFLAAFTQDGWWGATPMYRQHLALARLRAIESRRHVLQVAVTGTTAWIDPLGRVRAATSWMESGWLRVAVPRSEGTTYYMQMGDWVLYVASLLALVYSIYVLRGFRRHRISRHAT